MANSYFQFKQFIIHQDRCAMKVTTDGCLFGAWVAERLRSRETGAGSQPQTNCNVLDIGTGTGLLSLMLVQQNTAVEIDAIEIDEAAIKQANENITASPWKEKIEIHHADAKNFYYSKKYDCVISNPPFYENELKSDDAKKNLAHHNEGLLLPGLLSVIKKNLAPGGQFYLLLPYKRNEEIRKLLTENGLAIQQLVFVRQSVNHDYFRIMLAGEPGKSKETGPKTGEIAIKDGSGNYTPAFTALLKHYYLHL